MGVAGNYKEKHQARLKGENKCSMRMYGGKASLSLTATWNWTRNRDEHSSALSCLVELQLSQSPAEFLRTSASGCSLELHQACFTVCWAVLIRWVLTNPKLLKWREKVGKKQGRSCAAVWGHPESWRNLLFFSLRKIWHAAVTCTEVGRKTSDELHDSFHTCLRCLLFIQ